MAKVTLLVCESKQRNGGTPANLLNNQDNMRSKRFCQKVYDDDDGDDDDVDDDDDDDDDDK